MNQKEVACPAIIQNTAFSIVIKGFEPLEGPKLKEISVFCLKDHSNVSKAFSKQCRSKGNISGGARERRRRQPLEGSGVRKF